MGLQQTQLFITRYIRDPSFRARYAQEAQRQLVWKELELDDEGIKYLNGMPLEDLDRCAEGFRNDRLSKRQTEFNPFLDHLGLYTNRDDFLNQFDAAYPSGLETQPLELDRFLAFGTDFVLSHGLPEYLVELIRFSYHFCKIAVAPPDIPDGAVETLSEKEPRPYQQVKLRAPNKVLKFRFDVLGIAGQQPDVRFASIAPAPVTLFFQKHFDRYKRTRIYYEDQVPFLWQLINEAPLVIDLLAPWSASNYPQLVEQLMSLYGQGVIDVVNPPHMRSQD